MRWKEGIRAIRTDGEWYLAGCDTPCQVSKKDISIVEAIENGICEDDKLVRYLAEKQGVSEVVEGLSLAQFMVDYMDYIGVSQEEDLVIKP